MRKKSLSLFLSLLALTMVGCAGAGAGSALVSQSPALPFAGQPAKAVVRLNTTGALPAGKKIGGVSATLSYAGGKGLSIVPANVEVSGAGLGSTMVPNTNQAGQVVLGLINVNGIAAGEFATLSFDVARGSFPTAADFSIATGASAIDTSTQVLAGIGVSVASVTLQ